MPKKSLVLCVNTQKNRPTAVRRKCAGHPRSRALPQIGLASLFSGLLFPTALFPFNNQHNGNHASADQQKACKQEDRLERNR